MDPKKLLYVQLARLSKALASPGRVELLDFLSQGPQTVESLARLTAMTPANASQHLQVLRRARLVDSEKRGFAAIVRAVAKQDGERAAAEYARTMQAQGDRVVEVLTGRGLLDPPTDAAAGRAAATDPRSAS